jgi:RNA polymerase-binding transcription factor DksA/lipoprotein signal peptidase
VPEKFKRYYKLLVDLRKHLTEGIERHSEETLKRSVKDDAGDLSAYGQHMADAGTDTFDRDFALSLVSNEQEALSEIEAAIKRIRDGTYGICEITAKPISKERLLAVPFTRYSAEAQKQIERTGTIPAPRRASSARPARRAARFPRTTAPRSDAFGRPRALVHLACRKIQAAPDDRGVRPCGRPGHQGVDRRHLPFNTYGEAAGAIPVVRGFFYIVHVGNTGAAWSVFSGRSIVLASLAAATLVAIFIGRRALGLVASKAQACFGLCAGASPATWSTGSRAATWSTFWTSISAYVYPTFNVADSAICVGVVLYALYSLRSPKIGV